MAVTLRPSPTALLDPKCDSSFKAMFTADTKESNAALKDFISTILNREISELQLIQNEPPVEIVNQNRMSFDVSVKFSDGERCDIEMQSRQENYDYAARAEIQVARLLSTSNKTGQNWHTPAAYQISVLNFEFDKSDKSPLSWYTMRKENGGKLSDRLNVVFFDLIKIHRLLGKPVKELSKLEKWGLFLSYADDERRAEYIDQIIRSEGGLMNAKTSLCSVSKDEILWAQQNSIDKAMRDYNTIMFNAKQQGMQEGLEQGRKEGLHKGIAVGRAEGREETAIENAKNLYANGVSVGIIAKSLGMTVERVKELVSDVAMTV
ncbi:Rpn family recombination-promoting nuclease/putative transposase [uncultured Treponema sp.]|uniref:Rpn family recombination-promoting nuclease/putative transposase n=1 Tax=uncultured Treponema sp. TaxID=162155 RepID=UPI0025DC5E62|nr:Rpn family recombination-promoting nuclease/putative transposase [uncultured Treponema sp.]